MGLTQFLLGHPIRSFVVAGQKLDCYFAASAVDVRSPEVEE